jgi:hypothetical protein
MHPCLNGNQIWTARITRPDQRRRWDSGPPPPFRWRGAGGGPESGAHLLSTFKRRGGGGGGGVRNPGHTSSTVKIKAPGSTTREVIPDPPPFLPLSGGGGGSGIEGASLRRLQFKRPDQRCTSNLGILCHSVINQRGPLPCHVIFCAICSLPGRAMRLAPFFPFLILRHLSLPPLLVRMIPFPSHHPSITCHVSHLFPRQPPTASAPIMSCILLLPLIVFRHMSSPAASLTPHRFLLSPRGFGPITPLLCPIFRAGLHVYAPYRSANPGGSAKGSSTSQKCRVGRAILNPDEAVIEAVGGG